ncbi:hypothetical protein GCM10022288_23850 [Gryllotalpicola kribbensis]|uniref:ABC-2 type transporter transmembrane domain-containing protein n=1 Tax=Gryllotalpicola kribbensis TaxID=993084 RepID=A0ABP8AW87_9MICO
MTSTAEAVTPVEAPAPAGIRARYRAWYGKMPTGLQMIGLQLWLPVFFVIAFVFCYVFAFHAPAFKNVPVAVVGSSSVMQPVAEQLQGESKGAVTVRVVESLADAKAQVRSGELAAAYQPGDGSANLVIASAGSFQLASLAQQFFQQVGAASQTTVHVDDLAPLPAYDSFGTSLFYLTLVCTIAGYMVSMFVGMMGGGLKHWQRFSVFAGASILLPGLALALARFVVHAVDGHFFQLWAIGAATSFAVGCVVNGLAYFMGRFVTGAALLLFVFANVPGSGGAYPPALVPQPFRFLHDFVSGTATINLFRRTAYGVGPEAWHGWVLLGVYAAIGIVLALAGKPFFMWKMRRQRLAGKKSMMISAQIASMTHAGYVTPVVAGAATGVTADASAAQASEKTAAAATADGPTGAGAATPAAAASGATAPEAAAPTHAAAPVVAQPGMPATVAASAPQSFVVTATAASDSGPVELTVRLQATGEVAAAAPAEAAPAAGDRAGERRGRQHHERRPHDREEEQRDEERGMDYSVEEADGDAIAAETGALG